MRGDNVAEADGVLARGHLLGQVVRVERAGRPVWGGLGQAGAAIALFSVGTCCLERSRPSSSPRRVAGALLRRVQGLALYRRLGRRWQPAITIGAPSAVDLGRGAAAACAGCVAETAAA